MQRAVYGVDFATDAGPVSVLQDPAGPTRAGLCHTLEKDLNNSSVQTAPLRFCTNNNIYSPATFFFERPSSVSYVTSFVAAVTGILAGGIWTNPHFTLPLFSRPSHVDYLFSRTISLLGTFITRQ